LLKTVGCKTVRLMKRGFSLIELLVVISVTALLMGILLPVLSRARLQAKVVVVNAELREIGTALEMYMAEHNDKYPPVREDCWDRENFHQIPVELVRAGYLPKPRSQDWTSAGMEDRFNRGHTYKYRGVGDLIVNGGHMMKNAAWLEIPEGFPDSEGPVETDRTYSNPLTSPVTWVIYSHGPNYDAKQMRRQHRPVPMRSWYDPNKGRGVIVRMRLKNGRHIGSFEQR